MALQRWLLGALLLAPPWVVHAEQAPLTIGDTTIQFPVEFGYVPLSTGLPNVFALASAALPTSNKLVESYMTAADIRRMRQGGVTADPYYQVQSLRKLESRTISLDEWSASIPALSSGMARSDMDSLRARTSEHASARLSEMSHKKVDVSIGKVDAPVIYRETPTSIRFDMRIPVALKINNAGNQAMMLGAGAITLVRNKVVLVYLFGSADSGAQFAQLNARLDGTVDRMLADNPNAPSIRAPGTFNWKELGISALLGALVGAISYGIRKLRR